MTNNIAVSFIASKGGVGKTTLCYNLAAFLASKKRKVLIIDLDYQNNMSTNFNFSDEKYSKSDIVTLFHDRLMNKLDETNIRPEQVDKDGYLYGLSTTTGLDKIDTMFSDINNAYATITQYLNFIKADEKYDYIFFDNHNDFKLASENAIIASDLILTPIEPSEYSIDSIPTMLHQLEQMKNSFTDLNGNSYVTANPYYIGNLIDFNTKQSHEMVTTFDNSDEVITKFHRRQAFRIAAEQHQPVLDYLKDHMNNKSDERAFNEINQGMEKIVDFINDFANKQ